jgi:hypothetical protein
MSCAEHGGGTYDEVFFRLNPDDRLRANASARRSMCIGCEQTRRLRCDRREWPRRVKHK